MHRGDGLELGDPSTEMMSHVGHSRQGRASLKSDHVRYATVVRVRREQGAATTRQAGGVSSCIREYYSGSRQIEQLA